MKKLIILFCGTLALAACGNGLEKKANEKLMVANKSTTKNACLPG